MAKIFVCWEKTSEFLFFGRNNNSFDVIYIRLLCLWGEMRSTGFNKAGVAEMHRFFGTTQRCLMDWAIGGSLLKVRYAKGITTELTILSVVAVVINSNLGLLCPLLRHFIVTPESMARLSLRSPHRSLLRVLLLLSEPFSALHATLNVPLLAVPSLGPPKYITNNWAHRLQIWELLGIFNDWPLKYCLTFKSVISVLYRIWCLNSYKTIESSDEN